ncbi:1712_t:CDS:2 [Ambispora gerdemannii]|uniref:1712_t:CDS:1 n=1 Tax=Ambispora gerdemannii TaxID=144530 RepID=A0A9N8WDY7_9GLOM|nr:1712_t:CDS:2 [Ambispora gerdemannii]
MNFASSASRSSWFPTISTSINNSNPCRPKNLPQAPVENPPPAPTQNAPAPEGDLISFDENPPTHQEKAPAQDPE